MGRACGTHGEKNACRILQENLKDKEKTWKTQAQGPDIVQWVLKKCKMAWSGLIRLRITRTGGLL
jgi:hypothetical protein